MNSSILHESDSAPFGVCYHAQNVLKAENNMYISFHYLLKVVPYIKIIAQLVSIFAWNIYAPYFICISKEIVQIPEYSVNIFDMNMQKYFWPLTIPNILWEYSTWIFIIIFFIDKAKYSVGIFDINIHHYFFCWEIPNIQCKYST